MSQYLISGQLRRQKKKELSQLKSYVKTFWHFEDIDRAYGGGLDDKTCSGLISKAELEIKRLELELSKPAISIVREQKLNSLDI